MGAFISDSPASSSQHCQTRKEFYFPIRSTFKKYNLTEKIKEKFCCKLSQNVKIVCGELLEKFQGIFSMISKVSRMSILVILLNLVVKFILNVGDISLLLFTDEESVKFYFSLFQKNPSYWKLC